MEDASVSNCVLSIIASFTSGLDVFSKLRLRRKKKRNARAANGDGVQELQLSKSLRRGATDIHSEYERDLTVVGHGFATGDGVAQASLAETLIRLNSGLVGIIASFLTRDRNDKNELRLDYRSLIDLSEQSRKEAVGTLQQLFQRMSQTNLPAMIDYNGERYSRNRRPIDSRAVYDEPPLKPRHKKKRDQRPQLARIVIENKSDSQIAMVRSGHRRKRSQASSKSGDSNASSIKSNLSASLTSTSSSPLPYTAYAPPAQTRTSYDRVRDVSPRRVRDVLPRYVAYAPPSQPKTSSKLASERTRDSDRNYTAYAPAIPSYNRLRDQSPRRRAHHTASASKLRPYPSMPEPVPSRPTQARTHTAPQANISSASCQQPTYIPYRPPQPVSGRLPDFPAGRRNPSITPTMYSIATDSTKLGEIPLHKWTVPYDFEAMERLNEEAEKYGWPYPEQDEVEETRRRFGFLKIFKKRV